MVRVEIPDPDGQFRVKPCGKCGGENVGYQRKGAGFNTLWRVKCQDCGNKSSWCNVKHGTQLEWNAGAGE